MDTPEITELVSITWRDAYFEFASPAGEAREDYLVTTIGVLLSDGPIFLAVAAEVLPDGDGYRGVTFIPVELIVEVKPLL